MEEEQEESDIQKVLERVRKGEIPGEIVIVILWGASIATIFTNALFQNPYPTIVHYSLVFIVCLIGGALMREIGKALLGFFGAMGVAVTIMIALSSSPALSTLSPQGGAFIQSLMILIILRSTFPIPFIAYLVTSMFGALLGDRYLEEPIELGWTETAKT